MSKLVNNMPKKWDNRLFLESPFISLSAGTPPRVTEGSWGHNATPSVPVVVSKGDTHTGSAETVVSSGFISLHWPDSVMCHSFWIWWFTVIVISVLTAIYEHLTFSFKSNSYCKQHCNCTPVYIQYPVKTSMRTSCNFWHFYPSACFDLVWFTWIYVSYNIYILIQHDLECNSGKEMSAMTGTSKENCRL